MTPNSPKLLPWLAKKAGIELARAEELWRKASRYANERSDTGSSAWSRLAIDRLIALVAEESLRADAASMGWRPWARAQRRLWAATLHLVETVQLVGTRSLRIAGLQGLGQIARR